MNTTETTLWLERAFLFVEAALSNEMATPSRTCMTEDYFRSSLVRGLANSLPEKAKLIVTEKNATWSKGKCWVRGCKVDVSKGRPIQHDIAVNDEEDKAVMLFEVKWLKNQDPQTIMRDIWKLVLSRGVSKESHAIRTYLLIGGESEALSSTLTALRKSHFDLRWRNAKGQIKAARRKLELDKVLTSPAGLKALKSVLSAGDHIRKPPKCLTGFYIAPRVQPWLRTLDRKGWRAVLLEIHHHGISENKHLDFRTLKPSLCTGHK